MSDPVARLRQCEQRRCDEILLADLLRGHGLIFGKRIRVEWVDGAPFGRSNEQVAELIELGVEHGRTLA